MEVNACKQGDSRRVAYLAVEQGGQSVPACQLVEALTHAGLAFGREHLMPLTKLAEGALPEDLGESVPVFALEGFAWRVYCGCLPVRYFTDRAEAQIIKGVGVGTAETCPAPGDLSICHVPVRPPTA